VETALPTTDLDRLSPRQALDLLYDLKQKLDNDVSETEKSPSTDAGHPLE
jgi:hypothetical protein